MNPFGKPIEELLEADIDAFCNQKHPESSWLDYKKDFSSKDNNQIAKIVSALANAHGGIALLGVDEIRASGKPGEPKDWLGIDSAQQGEARVKNICLDAISPPIVPIVKTVKLATGKEIIVIVVHESDTAPHEIKDTNNVYIRTNDISHLAKDGKKAGVEEIEWLLRGRQKALAQKERLLTRAQQRSTFTSEISPPILRISTMPYFPSEPLLDFGKLNQIADAIFHSTYALSGCRKFTTSHESLCSRYAVDNQYSKIEKSAQGYFEINILGLNYHASAVAPFGQSEPISLTHCFALCLSVLRAADQMYKLINFAGLLDISLELRCARDHTIRDTIGITIPKDNIADNNFVVNKKCLAHNLSDPSTSVELLQEFLWSAGYGPTVFTDKNFADGIKKDHAHFFKTTKN